MRAVSVCNCAQEYKQNKEMLPKAAFQFGVKAGDGRKSGKDLTRKQDNKLSGQLRKIQARSPGNA